MEKTYQKDGKKDGFSRFSKNGDRKKAENYRGITLMDTGYKILAMIIEERLRKKQKD